MYSFREEQVGMSRYLETNNTLPILVNQNSNSDLAEKLFDIQKRMVHLKQSIKAIKAIN